MENDTPELQECPIECPNRRVQGVKIFGQTIEPFELVLQFAVIVLLLAPASKAAVREDFSQVEAAGWFGAIAGAVTVIRMSPTDRLEAWLKVIGRKG